MSTHLPGFQSFFRFLHHSVLVKFATSSIRVNKGASSIWYLPITELLSAPKAQIHCELPGTWNLEKLHLEAKYLGRKDADARLKIKIINVNSSSRYIFTPTDKEMYLIQNLEKLHLEAKYLGRKDAEARLKIKIINVKYSFLFHKSALTDFIFICSWYSKETENKNEFFIPTSS